jgi:uncharacterized phage-associated protein
MAYDGRAVANYFLELAKAEGIQLDHIKLQKLLYYAHGWHLAFYGEPLVAEGFQAWWHGPVSPKVYDAFSGFGPALINRAARRLNDELEWETIPTPHPGDKRTRSHIENIWAAYKRFPGERLSKATHMPGTPWYIVTKSGKLRAQRLMMDNSEIKKFFDTVHEKNMAKSGAGK